MCNLKPTHAPYALKIGYVTSLPKSRSHAEYFRWGLLMGCAVNILWLSTLARKRDFKCMYSHHIKDKRDDAVPNESRRGSIWLTNIRSREHVKLLDVLIIKDSTKHSQTLEPLPLKIFHCLLKVWKQTSPLLDKKSGICSLMPHELHSNAIITEADGDEWTASVPTFLAYEKGNNE